MWTYNVCMWMKFVLLYKGVILIVQGKCSTAEGKCYITIQNKCSNYTRGIQGYPLWKISINFGQLFFFVLSSKDCILSRYTFLYHTLILWILFNSHMTIQILIPQWCLRENFVFPSSIIFWTKPMEIWLTYLWAHIELGIYGI